MADITAIILAAGLGIRMGPRGRLMPKGMIEVGGRTMVAQSLDTLRALGVPRIRIVTGHLAETYTSAFDGAPDVEFLHNPDYSTTGSLLTLARGIADVQGPVVVLESDLIYAPHALETALAGGNRLVTSGPTGAGDEVYVWADGPNHLSEISKDRAAREDAHFGELVGITRLEADAVAAMRDVAPQVLAETPGEHYEAGMVALGRVAPIECVRLDDLPWAEIDDEEMLARAERVVFPRIDAARAAWPGLLRRNPATTTP